MNRQLLMSRQADMVSDPGEKSIIFIGCGGIGSNAVHMAASIGYKNITLVDPDDVAEENIYPGLFSRERIGLSKVSSLGLRLSSEMDVEVSEWKRLINECEDLGFFDIAVISTDTLSSRLAAWELYGPQLSKWWIDARMGGYLATVRTIDTTDMASSINYGDKMAKDREGNLPCGMKATAPMTKGFIAGMIGQSLVDIANGEKPKSVQRYDMEMAYHLTVE